MSTHEPGGLHSATIDDIRRLLACLNDLHAAAPSDRVRRLAAGLAGVFDAAAAAVCVAAGEAWATLAAHRPTRGSLARVGDGPDRSPAAFDRGAVGLTPPDAVGPAAVWSVLPDDTPATALVVRRAAAFEPRHAVMLGLLHEHVGWALASALSAREVPVGSAPVLELLLVGMPEKEIARRLNRSTHAVHGHIKRLYRHFDVSSKSQLIHHHNRRGDVR